MSEQPGEAVPAAQKTSWTTFLKSLASFAGDLSSLTAPPFILSPTSLTEFPAYWCERPELFARIVDGETEEERAYAVLKWFISTLKDQYTSRNESMGSEKKPLNPVLGELFYGRWPQTSKRDGETTLVVEQVSHHPPITAYRIANDTKGITLVGHSAQKTTFSTGSIIVKQVGHAILTLKLPSGVDEEYLITLPRLRIDGLWYGSPYIELTESSYIQSSTGWFSHIEYKGKGYFSGKSHSFKAVVSHDTRFHREVEGTWHTQSKFKDDHSVLHDVTFAKEEVTVPPVEKQCELESRRLWQVVAKGIREGDFDTAAREKSKIENEQRQMRRDESANGTKWELKHFRHVDNCPVYQRLRGLFDPHIGHPVQEDGYVYLDNGPHH